MSKLTDSTQRILSEDALKHIYKTEERRRRATLQSVAGTLEIALDQATQLINKMATHHLLRMEGEDFYLTSEGQDYALQVIRAHRLWEHYLAEETGFDQADWHNMADRQEHLLSPEETEALSARLGHPTHDPHGDPIPTADGEIVPHGGQPLTTLAPGEAGRIVHLEDEPAVVYAQLVAEGLYPEMEVLVAEVTPQRIRFWAGGDEHILAPIVAVNISIAPLVAGQIDQIRRGKRLTDLARGERGKVVNISPACRGPERRRLMDLGILPGTVITAEMNSPSGDPTAYLIRDALIALRKEQADLINITHLEEAA